MNLRRPSIISLLIVGLMLAASWWAWRQIPPDQPIPVHWGVDGQVDRYGGRVEGLLLLPGLALGLAVLLAAIPRFEPRRLNLERSGRAYVWVWLTLLAFLAGIHLLTVLAALGFDLDAVLLVNAGIGLLYLVIGFALPRTKSNFFFGIRTPWTLSSDRSWRETHRRGGVLFALLGLATLLLLPSGRPELQFALVVGGALLVAAATSIYSYFAWKGDPDKARRGRE